MRAKLILFLFTYAFLIYFINITIQLLFLKMQDAGHLSPLACEVLESMITSFKERKKLIKNFKKSYHAGKKAL